MFGKKWLYWLRVVVVGQKLLYSGKVDYSGNVVVFRQSACIRSNVVVIGKKLLYSGKSGCIRVKEVVFGQIGCIRANLVFLGKICFIRAKWLYSGKSGCSRE